MKRILMFSLAMVMTLSIPMLTFDAATVTTKSGNHCTEKKEADYYCDEEKEGGTWYYGLDYHPPAKDTAFSNYRHETKGSTTKACYHTDCGSGQASAGNSSNAKQEGWNYVVGNCHWSYDVK